MLASPLPIVVVKGAVPNNANAFAPEPVVVIAIVLDVPVVPDVIFILSGVAPSLATLALVIPDKAPIAVENVEVTLALIVSVCGDPPSTTIIKASAVASAPVVVVKLAGVPNNNTAFAPEPEEFIVTVLPAPVVVVKSLIVDALAMSIDTTDPTLAVLIALSITVCVLLRVSQLPINVNVI